MKYEIAATEPMALQDFMGTEFDMASLSAPVQRLVERIRAGLTWADLERLRARLDLPLDALAPMLGMSRATLHRRRANGRLTADESDRLLRYERLLAQATGLLGTDEAARAWLRTPAVGLGGAVPIEYAMTEVGAREVERLLGRLEHGVYA
jgi:putative toxin-antitoxin system antitoxin component (TIGR02293 family)